MRRPGTTLVEALAVLLVVALLLGMSVVIVKMGFKKAGNLQNDVKNKLLPYAKPKKPTK